MDRYTDYKKIAGLIAGEIGGTLSPEEKKTLISWINENEENKQLYYRLRNSSNFRAWQKSIEKVNTRAGWKELYSIIEKKKKKDFRLNVLKYAAILLLPIMLAGTIYYYVTGPRQKEQLVTEQTAVIRPGTSKAVLILNDGKSVTLDSGNKIELTEVDGTTIQKSSGQLNYTAPAQKAKEPLYNTIRIPKGGEYNLVLSDGTRVFLNAMTEFTYPVQFTGNARKVTLTGEAYFEVTTSETPFVVKTSQTVIKVLGTSFNVNAYENTGKVVTTLVEGKVRIAAKDGLHKSYTLSPEEQAVFNSEDLSWDVRKVDVSLYTGWKDGQFIFYDTRLEDIMNSLARWYSAEVSYSSPSIKNIRFSGSLNKYEDFRQILDIIQSTNKVKIEIENTTVLLKEPI